MPRIVGTMEVTDLRMESTTMKKQADGFPLNEDTAWLLGMYVAEGWGERAKIHFSIGENDATSKERLFATLQDLGFKA